MQFRRGQNESSALCPPFSFETSSAAFLISLAGFNNNLSMASFSKFERPAVPGRRHTTDRDLDILEAVLRYRFSSAAQIVRLAGGNEDVTPRRLRGLWERGLVAR